MADGPATSWSGIPVFGTYKNLDGTPKQGSLKFTLSTRVVDNTDDIIFPGGGSLIVKLGAETGSATINVPASDDPDVSPNGWVLQVDEKLSDGSGKSYTIEPKLADLDNDPPGINLRTVVVPPNAPSVPPTYMRGVAGGVAGLNSDGQVIDASGDPVTGGSGGSASWGTLSGKPAVIAAGATEAAARDAIGLGTAATADSSAFATSAQGAKADTAVQPADLSTPAVTVTDNGDGTATISIS